MRQAIIINEVVTNIVVGDAGGVVIPADSPVAIGWSYVGTTFNPPAPPVLTLVQVKTAQIATLTNSCGAAIVAGFPSSALGTAYTYPSKPNDQTNLIGAVASGLAVNFWAKDATGVWSRPMHTAAQIKQVLVDGATTYQAYSAKLLDLVTKVNAATATAAVQAIVW